jgi:polysaccharide biosynthesis protein PslH
MKLLMATHLLPYPLDMACKGRIQEMLRHLAARFDVTLVSLSPGPVPEEAVTTLGSWCQRFLPVPAPNKRSRLHRICYRLLTEVESLTAGVPVDYFYANVGVMKNRLRSTIEREGPFDVILTEYWYASELLSRVRGPLKVVDTHDVDYLKNEEMRRNLKSGPGRFLRRVKQRHSARREMEVLSRYDMVLALTHADQALFRRHLGDRAEIQVLPTGVDTDYFAPGNAQKSLHLATFYGAMVCEGNIRAALAFYEEIFPGIVHRFPDARYRILGANPPERILALRQDPRVTVTGFVPDVRPFLESSAVLVCPFRMGYGFRGRVLEAMALEVPVVSTTTAVAAMGLAEGEGILLRDGSEAFAEAVIDLWAHPAKAEALGKKGREVVLERFSLESTYGRFCRDLQQRLATRERTSSHA